MKQKLSAEQQRQDIQNEFDAFVYAVGHDLHAPVRGILHFSRMLERRCADRLEPKELDMLQRIPQMASKTQAMLDGLLELSRLGRRDWHPQEQDMDNLIEQAVAAARERRPGRAADFQVQGQLPHVLADRDSCIQMLTELLDNAILFNDEETAQVIVAYNDKTQTFSITDNGIGINESGLGRMFDAFCRLHHEGDYGGGLGLGLTRASKIVRLHDGRLRVESTPDAGATFYFDMPLAS